MATHVIETAPARTVSDSSEQRIVIHGVDWAMFQRLAAVIDDQGILLAYNRGELELMSPGPLHEDYKKLLARLIELVSMELEIPCRSWGSTLWQRRKAKRALESDESYFLTPEKVASVPKRSDKRFKAIGKELAPDLAIEVDISRSKIDRPSIYATLLASEVWRFDGETLRIDRLRDDGTYEGVPESRFIPVLPAEVAHWLLLADELGDETVWARQLLAWVRATVRPRYMPPPAL